MSEAMASTGDCQELIVGMTEDAQFGPVILFGQGGTAVEIIRDTADSRPQTSTRSPLPW